MGQYLVFADESVAVTYVYSAGQAHVFIVRAERSQGSDLN
jgi:hypothetical protein